MSDGVVVVDLQGRIISLNAAAEKVIGVSRKKAVGTTVATILPCSVVQSDPADPTTDT